MKNIPSQEGETHINIYSKSKLELGRLLSNFAYSPFQCEDGRFNSVEGYWYWLNTKDERLKKLYGFDAKKLGRELVKNEIDTEEFQSKIKSAITNKIYQNPKIKHLLNESSLPLDHYYYYGDINNPQIIYLPQYQWIVDTITSIRTELRSNL